MWYESSCNGTVITIGASSGDMAGTATIESLSRSRSRHSVSSPAVVMAITAAPRALASWMFPCIFSNTWSCGAIATTGIRSSMSAIGPCFISPAG